VPTYEYACLACGRRFDVIKPVREYARQEVCPACRSARTKRLIAVSQGAHTWRPGWWEDIDIKPIWIESKRQLIEECKKRGLVPVGWVSGP